MNDRENLIAASLPFLDEIKDMTTGTEVERWLNRKYGPGSALFEELASLVKAGIRDGWAANIEIEGPLYRRSRICDPSPETFGFSITAVYISSAGTTQRNPHDSYRGQYHAHPYGEFNMVVPLDEGAALAGPNGWCYGGWTAPGPGSHHYPEVKDGAVIALFFLPAGRISYNIEVPDPLPAIPE
jgi:Domain of unknown function (DUF4863)